MRRSVQLAMSVALALASPIAALAAAPHTFTGRLWIVPESVSIQEPPVVPTGEPDATFASDHLAFDGEGVTNNSKINDHYGVGDWLGSVSPVTKLQFSGEVNTAINAVVATHTPLSNGNASISNGTYGTIVALSGKVHLTTGQTISVLIDDGISVSIDGGIVFQSNPGFPGGGHFFFTGTTGIHTLDIVYTECCGGPATLVVAPFL